MNLFGNQHLRQVRQSLKDGDLRSACNVALSTGCLRSAGGLRTAEKLVDRLVQQAERHAAAGNLTAAWDDLSNATRVKPPHYLDELARRQTQLVETTVQTAESCLQRGQPANATRAIELLRKREIADRRADAIESVCRLVGDAESLSSAGRWKDAGGLLERAHQLRPDLEFIQSRIRVTQQGRQTVTDLTDQLRRAITQSHWAGAAELSDQILQIAPNNQVALDAHKHCQSRHPNPVTSASTPDLVVIADSQQMANASRESFTSSADDTSAGTHGGPDSISRVDNRDELSSGTGIQSMRSFMLWVDGVGGFLVCTSPEVTIGRAVERAEVDIPLQADIRRRHLRIKRTGTSYVAQPLDQVDVDNQSINEPTVLRNGQAIQLGGGVETRFSLPHPLGCSARIEFTSRHRTEPWSDAVLLLGDAILIGRSESHHIRAPEIRDELMVFRKGNAIVLRCPDQFEVNNETIRGEVALRDGLRVVGDGYSISVEQINGTAAE